MRNIILFETTERHANLLPLAYTRPIADFRVGILTIRQKWERLLLGNYSYYPDLTLRALFPMILLPDGDNIFINAEIIPNRTLAERVANLKVSHALVANGELIALRGTEEQYIHRTVDEEEYTDPLTRIEYIYDVFRHNPAQIIADYALICHGRRSQSLPQSNTWIGPQRDKEGNPQIYIEEGANVQASILNTTEGPIYIGVGAEVMEGSMLRGPLALCHDSHINMGAKIYPGTTIGPWCKVGGEINNTVFFGYSNKAHDGYLGNAVIGEWCNIGAGTNASNLKNDYSKIRVWNYAQRRFMRTDLQFCGLIMGDHSKIGINGMLNTATVMGVAVNLHGSGYPRTFIPSFTQGSPTGGFKDLPLDDFFNMAQRMMSRRSVSLTRHDRELFKHVAEQALEYK